PVVKWCGLEVSHVWRCGNRGSVASVLIEKPARGDFLPILEGGFSLQYSPLLEYREGAGRVVFCQLDVTGRTESDPAAARLAANLLDYLSGPPPAPASPSNRVLLAGGGPGAPRGGGLRGGRFRRRGARPEPGAGRRPRRRNEAVRVGPGHRRVPPL